MKPLPLLVILAGLAACSNPDREWAKKCVASGFGKAVCDCVAEKVPAKQREALSYMTGSGFGGGWVLIPNEEPGVACARHVDEAQRAATR
jgi:hypothetical protein